MAELVVALDYPDSGSALEMAAELKGVCPWVKVGLELFTAAGPGVVGRLKDMDFKVFLDLKFFDIPNTVRGAVRSAANLGADMVNIHLLGGSRMAEAALQGRDESSTKGKGPLIFGVTVLTSMGKGDLPLSDSPDPGALALDLAVKAKHYVMDGIVCSGFEVPAVKKACGYDFMCLTPGIRPGGGPGDSDDQRRVVTPAQAVKSGSDFLVLGRPITAAPSPAKAVRSVLDEMRGGKA